MMKESVRWLSAWLLFLAVSWAPAGPTTLPAIGEKVPSEDPVIADFHSLGLVNGQLDIFRCACPVRDLSKQMSTTQPTDAQLAEATSRMKHMYDLGIRTIISFQDPTNAGDEKINEVKSAVALERVAAEAAGIRYVSRGITNSGPDSLQTMSDDQVMTWLGATAQEIFADAKTGGVAFHCSAGHDRTGIVAAYLRIKYQHWPVEQAIDEMRRYGHNWPKFSADGGISSWHEAHLRAIAAKLGQQQAEK